jgi:uncharacterized membrane protein (DUF441 family)
MAPTTTNPPARDPFAPPPPPDAESVAYEQLLRRKGMRFGIVIMLIGVLGLLLTGLTVVVGSRADTIVYYLGMSAIAIGWGLMHFLKFHGREY